MWKIWKLLKTLKNLLKLAELAQYVQNGLKTSLKMFRTSKRCSKLWIQQCDGPTDWQTDGPTEWLIEYASKNYVRISTVSGPMCNPQTHLWLVIYVFETVVERPYIFLLITQSTNERAEKVIWNHLFHVRSLINQGKNDGHWRDKTRKELQDAIYQSGCEDARLLTK